VSEKSIARTQALVAVLEQVAMDDARVVQAANKCFSATRAELAAMEKMAPFELEIQLQARGWTREEFEIALEARKPRSEASYAVQMAHERTGMRIRQAVERGGPTVNVAVVIPAAIHVTDEEVDAAPVIDVGET
jgi:hypothetical protein